MTTSATHVNLPAQLYLLPYRLSRLSVTRKDGLPKTVNEWELKEAIHAQVRKCMSSHPQADALEPMKEKDLKVKWSDGLDQSKKGEPIAFASLTLWGSQASQQRDPATAGQCDADRLHAVVADVIKSMEGWEFRVAGVRLVCRATDDQLAGSAAFEAMEAEWTASSGAGRPASPPDTLRVCGVPSRWLAEERVSSKPSLLVAHTVFSALGPVR